MTRLAGIAPGATALGAGWAAAGIIALLTGASAVLMLLVAGAVGLLGAAAGGWWVVRRAEIVSVSTADLATAGEELSWDVGARTVVPVWVELRTAGVVVGSGEVDDGSSTIAGQTPPRGMHVQVEARISSAGRAGLVWWRRTAGVAIAPLAVASPPADTGAPIERRDATTNEGSGSAQRVGRDRPDGVRPWRDGDEVTAVHWLSSLRTQELIVRHQLREAEELWIVQVRAGTPHPDLEAARARRALDEGLRAGATVMVRVEDGELQPIATPVDAARWSATFETDRLEPERPTPWWRRAIHLRAAEPSAELGSRARWWIAAAGAAPLVMLLQPLDYGPGHIGLVLAATAASAAVTARLGARRRTVRQLAGLATGAMVAVALIDIGRVTSIASSLRFLMPQALVTLVVLQGFECVDRRSARVTMACSAVLAAYAAGVRVDSQLGIWLLLAVAMFVVAFPRITRTSGPARERRPEQVVRRLSSAGVAVLAVVAILAIVPVPRGPAQLTLPSWLEDRREAQDPGSLAAPDGSPLLGGAGGRRGGDFFGDGTGAAGSYAGFMPALDTSLRGDLGDEVVLRVKAPYPDYWRGQTFDTFDGRSWHVDDREGTETQGPDHAILPAEGDAWSSGDDFLQTFYAEVDLPNLVFAATSARRVLLDAPLWQRPDGALRAGVTIAAGSAYTVVSERALPTAEDLRQRGDIAGMWSLYLQLPDSTTDRTRELAQQLATGSPSTYDTILAIDAWLSANVVYDLDAPVPKPGADAVDDFLFETKIGFCEQIASATAIMLRSLGVPARVASGFVPSSRDGIAGVWISRASDAHAWVEVHFPRYGWVAFDPTASVPLSGEAEQATIGGELVQAIATFVGDHVGLLLLAGASAGLLIGISRVAAGARHRRRRGRWGLLQDRFSAVAVRRGAPPTGSNVELATAFESDRAAAVARVLDASAFSATWTDDDDLFARIDADVRELESTR